jgi:purine-binding chemotaxis protein CheW
MSTAVAPVVGQTCRRGTPAASVQLVGFRLGEEEYALRICDVREIILPGAAVRVPQAPPYVRGLTNLRGEVIPVVDLRLRLGMPAAENTPDTRIIVVNIGGKTLGLSVDSVSEVLRTAPELILPPPAIVGERREYIAGLLKLEGRLLIVLDLERLLDEQA